MACGPGPHSARTPSEALSSYARALERGDTETAYKFLSPEAQLGMSQEEFSRLARSSPESTRAFASLLFASDKAPRTIVTTTCGEHVLLVLEDGRWRVAPSTLDLYPTRTPKESARSFVLAYEAGRFDILYRLMPEDQAKELPFSEFVAALRDQERGPMTASVEALHLALDTSPFEVVGNRATLAYGKGRVLSLVLERGSWKVENY